ncbi:MAG: nicotinate-nucleotide diphosphorylase (carboxylating) [Bacteroidetes bacterium HGW-Bacteroidetes-16]|jgi:nicotinate-nucleotide pyrophosphorylase (carboxylating)|nr:MAG: nicotinate-nucleotide diphosphorylase (carboxylating) [Bacteroidetes bacterium HGW-Bacteroidetes-16]
MTSHEKETILKTILYALSEDLGDGDHTSLATISGDAQGEAYMLAKETGILAGAEVALMVFMAVDPDLKVELLLPEASTLKKGDHILKVCGRSRSILSAERTALNFIQRMSGIATFTHQVTGQLKGLKTKLLDTRKTTPCNRMVEKIAVRTGGGQNHRFGLYDMIMIKDNHIDFAGGIENAVTRTREYMRQKGKNLKIEVEVRNLKELDLVLGLTGIDRVMLDNFTTSELKKAVHLVNGKMETEASGGINIESIRGYAETGVDFISMGALTHQIKSLDISLKAVHHSSPAN